MEDGNSVEVAEVGNEGVLDVSMLLGGKGALTQATVQTSGICYRIAARRLRQELPRNSSLQQVLMRYTQTLLMQMAQTSGCVRRHSVEQQLCRCLLLNYDRTQSRNLFMTQEVIAGMLGVRRETVCEAAGRLQTAGHISYKRGCIEVLNRSGLESQACECYGVFKKEFDSLRSDLASRQMRADGRALA
jgi:CRP-like cAMP-binding protein